MVLIVILFGDLKWRIFATRTLRLRSCPVQGRRVPLTRLLPTAAIAAIEPEKQTQEEDRHNKHDKDQYGFQEIIHHET
jgi:hypothetical protein